MSLLNQMLKDLEKRQAETVDPAGLPGGSVDAKGPRRVAALLWILLAVALVLGGVLLGFGSGLWANKGVPTTVEQAEPKKMPVAVAMEPAAAIPVSEAVGSEAPVAMAPETLAPRAEAPLQAVSVQEPSLSDSGAVEPQAALVVEPPPKKANASSPQGVLVKTPRPLSPEEEARNLYAQGEAAMQGGRLQEAEQSWRQALRLDPAQRESREKLAALLVAAGRSAEAEGVYAAGLEMDPAHSLFRRGYARMLAERGDLSAAREVLQRGPVPAVTVDSDYHALLAALSQRLGDYAAAAATYSLLLQHDPSSGVSWLGLGLALESDGRAAEAMQAYRQALASGTLQPELLSYARGRLEMLER